ncbi:MAG: glycoside hydrolase family 3 protein [Mogibacterium sp.]|nr:glycoside hydrolase family 3 protein [Mogibacterium sp.]
MKEMMRKSTKKSLLAAVLILAMLFAGCLTGCAGQKAAAPDSASDSAAESAAENSADGAAENAAEVDARVEEILSGMTTEQKLAQMIVVSFRSDANNTRTATEINEEYRALIEKYGFGGVILMGGNIVDPAQTVTMIRDCQEAATGSAAGIPMFVSLDQEGGLVTRVTFGTVGPGNMALGAAGDPALTEECADILGQEVKALGFNMNFAPVADVNSNPNNPVIGTRSFSDDPEVVAEHVAAFVRGMKKNGVVSSLKHFPGHGDVGEDSHSHLPLSECTLEELRERELIPFRRGMEEGAEMIMTAHIQYPNIEKATYKSIKDGVEVCLPATLSRTIMTGLVREEMGYDGIIITDCMGMKAIADHFDPVDAAVLAINADVDILLEPVDLHKDAEINTFPQFEEYFEELLARVESGEIPEEQLDDSVARILRLKIRSGVMDYEAPESAEEQIAAAGAVVGSSEHHAREWEMAQRGLTLLKNEDGLLPLDGKSGRTLILYPSEYRRPAVDYAIGRLVKEGLVDPALVSALCYDGLTAEELREPVDGADRILVLSQSANRNEAIREVFAAKSAALLSLNLPYDAACYGDADAVLCSYNPYGSAHDAEGNGPFNLNVAVAVCAAFGEAVPQGKLPVNVPEIAEAGPDGTVYAETVLYERGAGLQNWGE